MKKINLTRQEIIEDMRNVFEKQGKLSSKIYALHGTWSLSKIAKTASFNELKAEAIGQEQIQKNNVPKEELVADVMKVAFENPKMTKDIYLLEGKYSRKPIERHFGTWNGMLTELGLTTNCLINIPEEDLLNELRRLITDFDTISATILKIHGKFSVEVYQRRFGSFNKALEKAGILPNMRGCSSPTANAMIRMCESILDEKAVQEKQFDWLMNTETKKPLYLDAYFEKYNLAFEYDGPQHFISVPAYGGNEGLQKRIFLDNLKNNLLKSHGIKLLRLGYNEPHTREYVLKKLSSVL